MKGERKLDSFTVSYYKIRHKMSKRISIEFFFRKVYNFTRLIRLCCSRGVKSPIIHDLNRKEVVNEQKYVRSVSCTCKIHSRKSFFV